MGVEDSMTLMAVAGALLSSTEGLTWGSRQVWWEEEKAIRSLESSQAGW